MAKPLARAKKKVADRAVKARSSVTAFPLKRSFLDAGSVSSFVDLWKALRDIDMLGDGPPDVPWNGVPPPGPVETAVNGGASGLPFAYQAAYVGPLTANLSYVLSQLQRSPEGPSLVETLAGAVYDHAPQSPVLAQLRRFMAVISDLYQSFLDKTKRASIDLPLIERLPPLAVFAHSGLGGPFTLPSDAVQSLFGGSVGVVSQPSAYRDHPVLWSSLAHETGGHDVTHADPGLLDELGAKVADALSGESAGDISGDDLGALWRYWVDETSADVYGILNVGPSFAPNLAAFFAALRARIAVYRGEPLPDAPTLGTDSLADQRDPYRRLDVHPVDIVRLHLAVGVTQALTGLAEQTKADYVAAIRSIADQCTGGAAAVGIDGNVVEGTSLRPIHGSIPMTDLARVGELVGNVVASAKLDVFGGHGIQEIETWDDADEQAARNIATQLQAGASIVGLGDDAQLLAGSTLALVQQPSLYAQVTRGLSAALDGSVAVDPLWGLPRIEDRMYRVPKGIR